MKKYNKLLHLESNNVIYPVKLSKEAEEKIDSIIQKYKHIDKENNIKPPFKRNNVIYPVKLSKEAEEKIDSIIEKYKDNNQKKNFKLYKYDYRYKGRDM